jgi:hypothetical protein
MPMFYRAALAIVASGLLMFAHTAPVQARSESIAPLPTTPCAIFYYFDVNGNVIGGFSTDQYGYAAAGWGTASSIYQIVALNRRCLPQWAPTD